MLCARILLLIGLAVVAISAGQGSCRLSVRASEPLFATARQSKGRAAAGRRSRRFELPGGFDKDVDMSRSTRKEVADPTKEQAGTVTINTRQRKLFLSLGEGRAIEYRIAVGRQGFSWKGVAEVGRKAFWARMDATPGNVGSSSRAAGAHGRQHGEPARSARALPVSRQKGHSVSHPRHQRARLDRQSRIFRMHPDAQLRRNGSVISGSRRERA